ncbi:DUF397 domain-containing protein [Amycolatopsis rubida]|uniref:DUF397 domain-containing protein n=1 Tax=Amycolatopsis rubida TaxID=112413 RepID=A0A1I5E562_9PSEU|nr:DUF397 domain-containing protein [Amycolatopsis rubida]SFO06400.1 protein of unknown function [Amycolatopsis rubida]
MTTIVQGHADDESRERWARSSYSTPNNNCVEVLILQAGVQVRDSKDVQGGTLALSHEAWKALLSSIMR